MANIILCGTILNKLLIVILDNIIETFVSLEQAAINMGLHINEDKTKYMCLKRENDRVRQNFTAGE